MLALHQRVAPVLPSASHRFSAPFAPIRRKCLEYSLPNRPHVDQGSHKKKYANEQERIIIWIMMRINIPHKSAQKIEEQEN